MWKTDDIKPLFSEYEGWQVELNDEALLITNEDGLQAYLAVSGEQILAEVVMFSADNVKDTASLNSLILHTHKMFPLSNIAINEIDNTSYYVAFGSLSSQSKAESIVIEVETLFRNVEAFLELYQNELSVEAE